MSPKNIEKKSPWAVLGGILAAMAALVAILAYLKIEIPCNLFANCQPTFTFTYDGIGKPIYEVAEGLRYADGTSPNLPPFTITVDAPNYAGSGFGGAMEVYAEKVDQTRERLGGWNNFRLEHGTPIRLQLSPKQLFDFTGLKAEIDAYSAATLPTGPVSKTFDLVVVYTDGRELARQTVTVVHTPWYHETYLPQSVLSEGETITIKVKLVNLGEPAKFKLVTTLYNASTPNLESLVNVASWWPGQTWGEQPPFLETKITEPVGKNLADTAEFTIPAEKIQAGQIYVLETVAYKELAYLKFPGADWASSDERWRYKDHSAYLTILVVK